MARPIYLDYMATTPVDEPVITEMLKYLGTEAMYGNPASKTHQYGLEAQRAIEHSRKSISQAIHAEPREIIWTSGATESNNLAIKGGSEFYKRKGRHLITVKTEHKAVLDPMHELERRGFEVTYLTPNTDGLISLEKLENAIREDTILVSVMHVNNEIGVIQDLNAIGQLLREKGGILFHVDAAQSLGKLPIDVNEMNVDLMSMSGHKIYGPKGIGALYVRSKPRVRLAAQMHGGGHELGYRSGTLAPHQIAGFAKAVEIALDNREEESFRIMRLRNKLWQSLQSIEGVRLNGSLEKRIAGNLNISFSGVDGESLLLALSDLAVSTTSACSSASLAPSYVLKAIGLSDALAYSSVRVSIGRFTTDEDINRTISIMQTQVNRLKDLAT